MNNKPRKQHFVPRFYLAEFTLQRSKDGMFWVLDRNTRTQWVSNPNNTAVETDFYCGDFGPDLNPYDLEKTIQTREAVWAPLIRRIIDTSRVPRNDEEDFGDLMTFIAFQAGRGASTRQYISRLRTEYSKREVVAKIMDETYWEFIVRWADELGKPIPPQIEDCLEDDQEASEDKRWLIQQQLWASIKLIPVMASRSWSLFTPEEGAPDFVCSDSPVSATSFSGSPADRILSYSAPQAVVTIPLGRRHALAGFYQDSADLKLPSDEVAGLNAMTIKHARWVYSADKTFTILTEKGKVGGPSDLLSQQSYAAVRC